VSCCNPENRANKTYVGNHFQRPMKRPPDAFDGEIKSDFTSSKDVVETHFDYYRADFSRKEDMISWLERILKDTVLYWHQARARNYNNLEIETTGQPTGKRQLHNLKTVTKSPRKVANYENYAIWATFQTTLSTSEN
jgi:hypothetical protein